MKTKLTSVGTLSLLTIVITSVTVGVSIFTASPVKAQIKTPGASDVVNKFSTGDDPKDAAAASPKPDFSVMEKWYEIVKYEYTDWAVERKLKIWVKPKVAQRPNPGGFYVEFRDKDGALVGEPSGIRDMEPSSEVGKVVNTYCDTPSETEFEKVATATVIRVRQ